MAQPCKAAMAARVGLGHLLDNFEDSRRPSSLSPRFRRVLLDGWMDRSPLHGRPRGCIYALGALGHAPPWLARDLPWERRELGFHKISFVQTFLFCSPACRRHIFHVQTPNNESSVSWLYGTKFPPTLVFIAFLGNEDKIFKSALEDNLFWFQTDCATGISGVMSPSSLTRIGPSTCPIRRYRRDPQLW
jgi:hypothetical protein